MRHQTSWTNSVIRLRLRVNVAAESLTHSLRAFRSAALAVRQDQRTRTPSSSSVARRGGVERCRRRRAQRSRRRRRRGGRSKRPEKSKCLHIHTACISNGTTIARVIPFTALTYFVIQLLTHAHGRNMLDGTGFAAE